MIMEVISLCMDPGVGVRTFLQSLGVLESPPGGTHWPYTDRSIHYMELYIGEQ